MIHSFIGKQNADTCPFLQMTVPLITTCTGQLPTIDRNNVGGCHMDRNWKNSCLQTNAKTLRSITKCKITNPNGIRNLVFMVLFLWLYTRKELHVCSNCIMILTLGPDWHNLIAAGSKHPKSLYLKSFKHASFPYRIKSLEEQGSLFWLDCPFLAIC